MNLAIFVAVLLPTLSRAEDPFLRIEGLAFPQSVPEQGQQLELVGRVNSESSNPPFAIDPTRHEYTWSLYGAVVHEVENPSPGIKYRHLTFGILEIREDPSFNSSFSVNPPNLEVPSTFHDGAILLLGTVTRLRIREIFGIFTATGDLRFEGGEALSELRETLEWSFDAAISTFGEEIPIGYGSRWTLELAPREPVGIDETSWGHVKALYR
jgi:hypothetical protein